MSKIKAFAAPSAGAKLEPFEFDTAELQAEEVEIKVHYCGICHSDLSMINNEWGMTAYPLVPGHEVAGEIIALGKDVKHLKVGQKIGLGWYSKSCMVCDSCMDGDHNLCSTAEATIGGRHGGFADKVRCHYSWAIPIPEHLPLEKAGPLFCGGITVFNPIIQCNVKPTEKVGVVGIGGLGHMAISFLNKWGCNVTAFTSSASKAEEARKMGAHNIVDSTDPNALENIAGTLDFLLVTVNVPLNWDLYLNALRAKGRLHFVGAVLEPIPVGAFSLITKQRSVSGTPLGSPETTRKMLEFCVQHNIAPQIEMFPMSKVNDAIEHLHAGKARYRIVLKNDF